MTATVLKGCQLGLRTEIVRSLPERSLRALNAHFPEWAHPGQLEPAGDWRTWVMMAGRGWGKTRAGAEWVLSVVRGGVDRPPSSRRTPHPPTLTRGPLPPPQGGRGIKIALVAASLDEARRVMVEGPSGLLALARAGEVADWSPSKRVLTFANGAEACLFSGANPEGLRGPEHDLAWCDELSKWRHAAEAWSNLQLGLRRGGNPRALVTSTPRRGGALRAILGEAGVVVTGGGSGDNPHLPNGWAAAQAARMGPGLLARQELGGELLDEVAGSLWPRDLIERCRVAAAPLQLPGSVTRGRAMVRVLIGVDPPAGDGVCGIVACGLGADGLFHVLGDHSAGGLSPRGWAARVAGAAAAHGADAVVAEANQGGRMVAAVLEGAGLGVGALGGTFGGAPVLTVHAREGKAARAAPVAALFEAGRARFAGAFPRLEDELAGLGADGSYDGPGRSPDRADAMVWAMTRLMADARGAPAVAGL